jgi:NADH-quinone oxidoreductase subunit H
MAGWASANKFSLMGALRGAAQLIAYELPLVLAAASVVIQAGTLSMIGIVEAQERFWFIATQPIGFFIFTVAALAELNRPPFDMPIAESEIIFGHMTEYTGLRYAFFMLTEYAGMVVLAAMASVMFLGGWYIWPGIAYPAGWPVWLTAIIAAGVTVGKIMTLVFLMVWLRATFPRLREDQLQRMSWLVMIPIGLFNIVVVAIAKVVA